MTEVSAIPRDHRRASRSSVRRARCALLLALAISPCAWAGDGCTLGNGPVFTVTNNGFQDYVIDGAFDPDLTVVRGCTYTFNVNNPGHPFLIKTVQGSGFANAYNVGVTNNAVESGVLTWTVATDAPATLFYNCGAHSAMTGTIDVIDPVLFEDGFES
jgi:hypothetical protein